MHCHGGQAAVAAILADLQCVGVPRRGLERADRGRRAASDPVLRGSRTPWPRRRPSGPPDLCSTSITGRCDHAVKSLLADAGTAIGSAARGASTRLLQYARLGLHLTVPWQVVVAGPPNVGKSSLINALVGYQRAVVFDMPGTTRDVVTVSTAIDGWPVELSDTAGIRATDDPLEARGMQRAIASTSTGRSVIWVFDATQLTRSDRRSRFAATASRPVVGLQQVGPAVAPVADRGVELLATSAVTRQGTGGVDRRRRSSTGSQAPPTRGTAVPFQPQVKFHRLQDVRAVPGSRRTPCWPRRRLRTCSGSQPARAASIRLLSQQPECARLGFLPDQTVFIVRFSDVKGRNQILCRSGPWCAGGRLRIHLTAVRCDSFGRAGSVPGFIDD